MNVFDFLKELSVDDIKEYCKQNTISAAIGMTHVSGDFNFGNLVRSANFFGYKEVYYVGGKKHYDRRSTVGTHHYTPLEFVEKEEDFISKIKDTYSLICVENNIPKYESKTVSLFSKDAFFDDLKHYPPLFLFGEEQLGISDYLLDNSVRILTVPAFGSVRSLNVGSCAAIVMALYRNHVQTY